MTEGSDPFIGKWKLDPSRSKMSDEMKVATLGENKYAFDFGAGNSETILADGTDQPGEFGTTLAVKALGPNTWSVIRKMNGQTMITAKWELSEDGKTLTDHYTSVKSDGTSKTTDYIYKRTAGTDGFSGTWESAMEQSAVEVQIQPYDKDGLAFIFPSQGTTKNIKFDGKDYPGEGPGLPEGFTSSGRRVNERTLEVTEKIGGKPLDTQQTEVSADLRTLTVTMHMPSQSKARVMVFGRE
jgi:hypothetical protein